MHLRSSELQICAAHWENRRTGCEQRCPRRPDPLDSNGFRRWSHILAAQVGVLINTGFSYSDRLKCYDLAAYRPLQSMCSQVLRRFCHLTSLRNAEDARS